MDAVAVDPLGRKHRQIHSAGGAHDSHIEAASRDGLSILSGADASRQNVLQGTSGSSVPARRGTWGLLVPELAVRRQLFFPFDDNYFSRCFTRVVTGGNGREAGGFLSFLRQGIVRWESGKPAFGFPLFHPLRRRPVGNVGIA